MITDRQPEITGRFPLPKFISNTAPARFSPGPCFCFNGDTILNMKGSGELNNFCCDCDTIKESFKKLLPLRVKTIYPGHGRPLCNLDGLGNVTQ